MHWPKVWTALERVSTAAVIVMAVVVVWTALRPAKTARRSIQVPRDPISLEGTAVIGDSAAPAAMIVFSDFECPYCGSFARDTWGRLREEYVDRAKLLVAFRHLPLPIHAAAFPAAQAAECARRQGKFWEMHDLIFGDQTRLNTPTFRTHARQLQLDERQWESCYIEDGPRKVKGDVSSARALGIEATPVFLIGTIQKDGRVRAVKRFDGAKSFEVFAAAFGEIAGR